MTNDVWNISSRLLFQQTAQTVASRIGSTSVPALEELKAEDLFLHDLRASVKVYDMLSKSESREPKE